MGKKSELLLDDNDIVIVQTQLAVLVGDRQAMALQQIHYWSNINQKADKVEHYKDDQWWVYNTWNEWHDNNFPFWSLSTIRRVFADLDASGLIVTRPHPNKNKGMWVTINYGQLELIASQKKEAPRVQRLRKRADTRSVQIEQTSKLVSGSVQIEQVGLSKMNRQPVQIEQDTSDTEYTENTTETTKKKKESAPEKSAGATVDFNSTVPESTQSLITTPSEQNVEPSHSDAVASASIQETPPPNVPPSPSPKKRKPNPLFDPIYDAVEAGFWETDTSVYAPDDEKDNGGRIARIVHWHCGKSYKGVRTIGNPATIETAHMHVEAIAKFAKWVKAKGITIHDLAKYVEWYGTWVGEIKASGKRRQHSLLNGVPKPVELSEEQLADNLKRLQEAKSGALNAEKDIA